MGRTVVECTFFVFMLASLSLQLSATFLPGTFKNLIFFRVLVDWKTQKYISMRLDTSFETSGLWQRCEIILQKSVTCHPLMRMIGGYYNAEYRSILVHRFLVVVANVVQAFSVIFAIFGLKCTNLAHKWKRCSLTTASIGIFDILLYFNDSYRCSRVSNAIAGIDLSL
jgi:hypothetical protein